MPKPSTPPRSPPSISTWSVLALLTVFLLAGCKSPSLPLQPKPVRSVQLPPLPAYARQPTTPSACLPTCLDALMQERESWQTLLNNAASLDEPASAPTTPPAKR